MSQTIGIAGGTGFLGRHISRQLTDAGHKVIIFSRERKEGSGAVQFAQWDPRKGEIDTGVLASLDGVLNLAGAAVADKRWTAARKKEILSSRVDSTRFLISALQAHAPRCRTFVCASATGYYGPDRGGYMFVEDDPPYDDFLAQVCLQWEAAARNAEAFYRTAIFRFGIVLGRDGGAYPQLAGPMRLGVMPILGSGRQMVSWVHVDDVAGMIAAALDKDSYRGVYNAVAPYPVMHKTLMKAIAYAKGGLKIPVQVPPFILRIIMGEASTEVLKSCTASSEKVRAAGYQFRYPEIAQAMEEIVGD